MNLQLTSPEKALEGVPNSLCYTHVAGIFQKKTVISRKISSPGASAMCFGLDGVGETLRVFGRVKILSWKKKSVMLSCGAPDQGWDTLRSLSME